MIRLFLQFSKPFLNKSTDFELNVFNHDIESIDSDVLVCPVCKAKHTLSDFASYERNLVTYDLSTSTVSTNVLTIPRYICSSCGHTHAVLSSVIIPYMSFSFGFVVALVKAFLAKKFTSIEALCNHFCIAITTFYRIFKQFKTHKALWLGILAAHQTSDATFISFISSLTLNASSKFKYDFFSMTALSFLQPNSRLPAT
jgi:rubredoxin